MFKVTLIRMNVNNTYNRGEVDVKQSRKLLSISDRVISVSLRKKIQIIIATSQMK